MPKSTPTCNSIVNLMYRATGLESGSPSFTGIDGSTERVAGTYSGGTRTIDTLDGE